jgi:methylmalonyl-CoA mutase N-terminal domain/subunit
MKHPSQLDYQRDLGDPGEFPYTRGIYPNMYQGRLWTMRQFSGYGSGRNESPLSISP